MTDNSRHAGRVVRALLGCGALHVAPAPADKATWVTWRENRSPVAYLPWRLGLDPGACEVVALAIQAAIRLNYPTAALVVGSGAGGASLAPVASRIMGLPHLLHWGEEPDAALEISLREHGETPLVIVDHLVASGRTLEATIKRLRARDDVQLLGAVAVVSAGQRQSREVSHRHGVPLYSLVEIKALLESASDQGKFSSKCAAEFLRFFRDPENYEWNTEELT